jgi:hypothetical protein
MRVAVFEPIDRFLVPFHVLWLGGFVFLMLNKTIIVSPVGLPIVVIFLGVGLYALFGRLIIRALAVRSSTYTITDQRLTVTMRVFGRRREFSEHLRTLKPPLLDEHHDGTGTIKFGSSSSAMAEVREMQQTQRFFAPNPLVLHAIPHARHVRDIIATAQRKGV